MGLYENPIKKIRLKVLGTMVIGFVLATVIGSPALARNGEGAPRQEDRRIDRQADRQSDRRPDRQTDRQGHRQADRRADRQAHQGAGHR